MNVDIYIRSVGDKKQELRIPLLPEEITYKGGDGKFVTYDIMGKGEVALPTGVGLATVSWESEFPGANWPDMSMLRGKWYAPAYYHRLLENWKKNKTPLIILVTGFPINLNVYVSAYTGKPAGPHGSMTYEVEFVERQSITVSTSTVRSSSGRSSTTKRSTDKTQTYKVRVGDNCWNIALKFYKNGLEWPKIYKANKEIIEQTAKKYGRSSSDNGWWIYPGVTLVIP